MGGAGPEAATAVTRPAEQSGLLPGAEGADEEEALEVASDDECAVCLSLLYEPTELPCGHTFW